jgi:hypothetical protein
MMPSQTGRRSAWLGLPALLIATFTLASAATLPIQILGDPSKALALTADTQCSYSLNTTTVSAPASGGYYAVNVITRPGCSWAVTSAPRWVTLSTTAGVGRGTVVLEVQANPSSSSRSGTIEIEGQTVTVRQDGAPPCDFSVSPTYVSIPAAGGNGEVSVVTRSGCQWSVASNQRGRVPAVTRGAGSAKISFSTETNDERIGRTAELTVGPCLVWVSQSGKPRRPQ